MDKIIHYCWFGGKPLPKLAKKCIKSWQKFCPDYEIKEWNESNYNVNVCEYVAQAYAAKKYAFVSDYARFDILYRYGGVYLDVDVELIRPLDEIIEKGNFFGCETDTPNVTINTGLGMAAEKRLDFYKIMLEQYEKEFFYNKDGSYNLKNVVVRTTDKLKEFGLEQKEGIQKVGDIFIYPKEYFNPCDMQTGRIKCTPSTYSIHHYAASWVSKKDKIRGNLYKLVCRVFGNKIAGKIKKLFR